MAKRFLLLLTAAAVATACESEGAAANRMTLGEPQAQQSTLPAEIQLHIDEGNGAYRARDYEAALEHYQAAADLDPAQPTAWFGVAMAAAAMGDEERAEAARQRVQALDPGLAGADHAEPMRKPHP